jgi:hypothetical protein
MSGPPTQKCVPLDLLTMAYPVKKFGRPIENTEKAIKDAAEFMASIN